MKTLTKQQGMSFWGLVVVLAIGGFFVLFAVRLVPAYLEFGYVRDTLDTMKEEEGMYYRSQTDIRTFFGRRIRINQVESITDADLQILLEPNNVKKLEVDYAVQKPLFANIDVVANFKHTVTLRGKQ